MKKLTKEEKKLLMRKWKTSQKKEYILSKDEVEKLFIYLESELEQTPCQHTRMYTKQWLKNNLPQEKIDDILNEMEEMGGYCDCEVLLNCYEDYDIE